MKLAPSLVERLEKNFKEKQVSVFVLFKSGFKIREQRLKSLQEETIQSLMAQQVVELVIDKEVLKKVKTENRQVHEIKGGQIETV